jgi:glutaredoxin/glutathione-dependent peroxiredoxin
MSTIEPGQKLPSVKIKRANATGGEEIDVAELFKGKTVVMFSLPGAFTPTCSSKHLPGYVAKYDELRAKGVDLIACLSVNDAFVMQAWADAHGASDKIVMLADGAAALSKALGIDFEIPHMGVRARRGVFSIVDNVVKTVDLEAAGKFEVSSAEACLLNLK